MDAVSLLIAIVAVLIAIAVIILIYVRKGQDGKNGYQGVMGSQRQTSSGSVAGFQGIQGYQGTKGNQGTTGDTGLFGMQGQQGITGMAIGNIGYQGFQGDQGYTGNTGQRGAQGESSTNYTVRINYATAPLTGGAELANVFWLMVVAANLEIVEGPSDGDILTISCNTGTSMTLSSAYFNYNSTPLNVSLLGGKTYTVTFFPDSPWGPNVTITSSQPPS